MGGRLPVAVWAFAASKIAFHLVTTRWEHHRDELYFVSASKRLAFSYVDFQPVTPFLVRATRTVFGESLLALRVVPALAGGLTVVLAALIVRELGGDRRAQIWGAFALLVVPLFVGMSGTVNTVSLETPAFMLVAFVLARLIRTDDERLFLALGVAAGLSLLVKFTALGYLAALVVAILASPLRKYLRSPWLWAGVGLSLAMVLPSLLWQFAHDLPVVEFVSNQSGGGAVLGLRGRLGYVASLLVLPGPLALALTVPGSRWLFRNARARPVGIAVATAIVGFLIASGKGYYAAPAIAVLLCGGALAVARWTQRARRTLAIALIVNLLIPLPLLVPLVPVSILRGRPDLADATELGERIGWEELAETVGDIARTLDPDERRKAIVLGRNYTLPAAMEFYADRYDLPPAVSGHNSAYLWWPDIPRDHVAIVLGFDEPMVERDTNEQSLLDDMYGRVERVGTIKNREGVDNYEWGKPIFVARDPKVSPGQLRARVKIFTA